MLLWPKQQGVFNKVDCLEQNQIEEIEKEAKVLYQKFFTEFPDSFNSIVEFNKRYQLTKNEQGVYTAAIQEIYLQQKNDESLKKLKQELKDKLTIPEDRDEALKEIKQIKRKIAEKN